MKPHHCPRAAKVHQLTDLLLNKVKQNNATGSSYQFIKELHLLTAPKELAVIVMASRNSFLSILQIAKPLEHENPRYVSKNLYDHLIRDETVQLESQLQMKLYELYLHGLGSTTFSKKRFEEDKQLLYAFFRLSTLILPMLDLSDEIMSCHEIHAIVDNIRTVMLHETDEKSLPIVQMMIEQYVQYFLPFFSREQLIEHADAFLEHLKICIKKLPAPRNSSTSTALQDIYKYAATHLSQLLFQVHSKGWQSNEHLANCIKAVKVVSDSLYQRASTTSSKIPSQQDLMNTCIQERLDMYYYITYDPELMTFKNISAYLHGLTLDSLDCLSLRSPPSIAEIPNTSLQIVSGYSHPDVLVQPHFLLHLLEPTLSAKKNSYGLHKMVQYELTHQAELAVVLRAILTAVYKSNKSLAVDFLRYWLQICVETSSLHLFGAMGGISLVDKFLSTPTTSRSLAAKKSALLRILSSEDSKYTRSELWNYYRIANAAKTIPDSISTEQHFLQTEDLSLLATSVDERCRNRREQRSIPIPSHWWMPPNTTARPRSREADLFRVNPTSSLYNLLLKIVNIHDYQVQDVYQIQSTFLLERYLYQKQALGSGSASKEVLTFSRVKWADVPSILHHDIDAMMNSSSSSSLSSLPHSSSLWEALPKAQQTPSSEELLPQCIIVSKMTLIPDSTLLPLFLLVISPPNRIAAPCKHSKL